MIDIQTTLILLETDLIDPTKNKKADITLDAFQSYVPPHVATHSLVLYLSPRGNYIVLKDLFNGFEKYTSQGEGGTVKDKS